MCLGTLRGDESEYYIRRKREKKRRPEFLSFCISSNPDVQTLPRSAQVISHIHLINSARDGRFQSRCCIQKNTGSIFFPTEFDWLWKLTQLVSSRLSDLAPTAALGSILRFKLKCRGLCCYGYSVFTLTAPTKPCNHGSITAVESLSRIGGTEKPFASPSISSGCLWNTFGQENICICWFLLQPSTASLWMMTLQQCLSTLKTNTKASTFLFSFFLPCLPGGNHWCCCHQPDDCSFAAVTPPVHVPSFLKLSPRFEMTRGGRSLLCDIAKEARF